MSRGSARERGTISLELAILAIPLLMLLMLMWVFGVYAEADAIAEQAARDAVRAATQARSADEATKKIGQIVEQAEESSYVGTLMNCEASPNLPDPFTAQPVISQNEMVTVSVRVVCDVDLSAAGPIPMKNATVEGVFVSPLDSYRGYYP